MAGKKRFDTQASFPLPIPDKRALEILSEYHMFTVSQLIREAIRDYLAKEENQTILLKHKKEE